MQDGRGIKRIPLARAENLPWLKAPAGYVIVIEDLEYGNRFIILRLQEVNSRALARAAAFPFETELYVVFSAPDAAELARELHGRFAATEDHNQWFDLDEAQAAQLREFGRPQAPSLRDLALRELEGQSLLEKSRIVSAKAEGLPAQARTSRQRPQRRWPAWLLLLAIVALVASVLGNAPQLSRLLSGRTSLQEMLGSRSVVASATADPSPSPTSRAATSTRKPTAVEGAGEQFSVIVRANARVCASRECRPAVILEAGSHIAAQWQETGQSVGGNSTWIAFRRGGSILYVHSSALSPQRTEGDVAERPSATATLTAVPSATAMPSRRQQPTDSATPTNTREPSATNTSASTFTDEPTETKLPTATFTATATDLPAALTIDTANNLNANVRACPNTECEILGKLRPGATINPTGEVEGEVINGIALWIEFDYDGDTAYVHGELAAESP